MVARFEDLLLQSSANAAYAASVKNPASARKIASDKNKSPRKGFDWKPLREVSKMRRHYLVRVDDSEIKAVASGAKVAFSGAELDPVISTC